MATRNASAVWEGDLKGGHGKMRLGSGAFEGSYSFASRFESGTGTNPEELAGAAHAGCFSMAFANAMATEGHTAKKVATTAKVHLEKGADGFKISLIELECEAEVPGIDGVKFHELAEGAKRNCPISKLYAGTEIRLNAKLTR